MTIRENVRPGAPMLGRPDVVRRREEQGLLRRAASAGRPTSRTPEFGGYTNFRKDGEQVAGLMAAQEEGMPDVWSVYLAVADAEKTVGGGQGATAPRCSSSRWRSARSARWRCWPTPAGPRSACGSPASTAAASSAPAARRATSSSTPATTTRRSRSTGTCSAGTRRPAGDTPDFRYTVLERRRRRERRDHGRLALAARGRAGALVACTSPSRTSTRRWPQVGRARRRHGRAGRGHPLRRAGHRGRRHRRHVQAPRRRADPGPDGRVLAFGVLDGTDGVRCLPQPCRR